MRHESERACACAFAESCLAVRVCLEQQAACKGDTHTHTHLVEGLVGCRIKIGWVIEPIRLHRCEGGHAGVLETLIGFFVVGSG